MYIVWRTTSLLVFVHYHVLSSINKVFLLHRNVEKEPPDHRSTNQSLKKTIIKEEIVILIK